MVGNSVKKDKSKTKKPKVPTGESEKSKPAQNQKQKTKKSKIIGDSVGESEKPKIKHSQNGQKTKKAKVRIYQKKNFGESEKSKIEHLQNQYKNINVSTICTFKDFPLSENTLWGLQESNYEFPTEIQKETIGLSLLGKDVLGAAKTGSGKTLAFVIPILEVLYCKQWTRLDGLGALVLTPTRELAYQIFETLRKVGTHHDFSAALVIGGKDLKFERSRMDHCNIIIGTPGRVLQHMDENPLFDCVNMQILVLDEADRCLDMGFEQSMNAIIANLPPERQTLLFSATQTRSVRDLARLSLRDPSYVSVHEHAKHSTPEGLEQSYVVCELHDKLSILWSFLKNHVKQKMIVFFASCKQVKYVFEIFSKLRPGVSLLALYGTLHQLRRMDIYKSFCEKSNAVLFATDLAARGLDFPKVNWVVQVDCPENADMYIHRVGRTARYHNGGESFLMLMPSEENSMLEELQQRKIPIENIQINPEKLNNPIRKMEAFLAKNNDLKESAKRAFVSYLKAVFLMKNKSVFNMQMLDTDSFAHSLGLAVPPRIRFLQRYEKSQTKVIDILQPNLSRKVFDDNDDNEEDISKQETGFGNDSDSDDGILKLKRKDHEIDEALKNLPLENFETLKSKKPITKAALVKKLIKKKIVSNKKIVFDDDGEAVQSNITEKRSELAQQYEVENQGGIDIEKAKLMLQEEDKFDKQLFHDKVKAKHKIQKKKLKEKQKREQEKEQEIDEFGSESDEYEPDLSWLPDPDNVYEEKMDNDNDSDRNSNDTVDEVPENVKKLKSKKRKLKPKQKEPVKKKRKSTAEDVSTSLSINEAEELALMLLQNKK